jgi:hypothetical protein
MLVNDLHVTFIDQDQVYEMGTRLNPKHRVYAATALQQGVQSPASVFVGPPVNGDCLRQIRLERNLSRNYGVMWFPKQMLPGLSSRSAGIIEERGDLCLVKGLLPTDYLRRQAIERFHLLEEETMIVAPTWDFPGLKL